MYKWIGLIIGFWVLGIFGGLLGLFIGNIIDRIQSMGVGGFNPLTAGQRQTVFLETAFILMGKLAKADGHISQDEIDHVEAFIKKNGMTAENRKTAIKQFKKGSQADFDITETMNKFMEHCGQTINLKQVLLVYLIVMALADGRLVDNERKILEQIAQHLNYNQTEFNQILNMVLGQAQFSSGQQRSGAGAAPTASALEDAYKALGVNADSTDQQIKRAYRKLMSQYHPDKLMGQGVPEDMIKVATEQAKEIQIAYDLIKKHRGIK